MWIRMRRTVIKDFGVYFAGLAYDLTEPVILQLPARSFRRCQPPGLTRQPRAQRKRQRTPKDKQLRPRKTPGGRQKTGG